MSARRPAPAAEVDTMKVAGMLLCLSAVVSVVMSVVARTEAPTRELVSAYGGAVFALLLGLGLIMGKSWVRILFLLIMGFATIGLLAIGWVLRSFREVQAMALAVLILAVGYFVLLFRKEGSRTRATVGAALVVVGMASTVATEIWMMDFGKRIFGDALRRAASDQPEYDDPEAGLSIKPPAGWVILRRDAELYRNVPSRVTLAQPDAGAVAFINQVEKPLGLANLDQYLDGFLANVRNGGIDAEQTDRSDTTVGPTAARRMALTWAEEGRRHSGFITAWIDGKRVFSLMGATLGPWTDAVDRQFAALEGALRFTAPVATALTDAEQRVTSVCPIFTAESVRMVARRIPAGSAAEDYFRVGWSWAIKGQAQLDAASVAELRELMGTLFAGMSASERQTFGTYSEKVRGGRRTGHDEDMKSMRILGEAARRMPAASLGRLQALTDAALTVGALL